MSNSSETKDASEARFVLKSDFVDLLSARIQMIFAGMALSLIYFFSWHDSLSLGFLQDDWGYFNLVRQALSGTWQEFSAHFAGICTCLGESASPLVLVSFFFDYLVWGNNAWGFHLTNLLLIFASSLLVGLIALELSGLRGNRMQAGAAIWSALLFAVYPLHLEAGAWISGRVDMLLALCYLISVFCFLRFKLLRERSYFHLSLASFAGAMLCAGAAATLPLLITAAELILNPFWHERSAPEFRASLKNRRLTCVLSYWFVLGIVATWRLAVPPDLSAAPICSSGTCRLEDLRTNLAHAAGRFFAPATLNSIFFPVNMDLVNSLGHETARAFKELPEKILKVSYGLVAACFILRVLVQSVSWRILSFLAVWIFLALLPVCQAGELLPNLSGSRLFFLASAPFVILLSFLALPTIDALGAHLAKICSSAGVLALFLVLCVWSFWLQFDMLSWKASCESLKVFREQILALLAKVSEGRTIALLDLPSACKGAGLAGRPEYLKVILRPPFTSRDYSLQVITLDTPDNSARNSVLDKTNQEQTMQEPAIQKQAMQEHAKQEHAKQEEDKYDYAGALAKLLKNNKSIARLFIWKGGGNALDAGYLCPWSGAKNVVSGQFLFNFTTNNLRFMAACAGSGKGNTVQMDLNTLQSLPIDDGKEWTVEQGGGRSFQITGSGLRVRTGNNDVVLVLPCLQISPLKATLAELQARTISGSPPPIYFMWAAQTGKAEEATQQGSKTSSPHYPHGTLNFFSLPVIAEGRQKLVLGENRNWALTPSVGCLALRFPKGDYEIELQQLELKGR